MEQTELTEKEIEMIEIESVEATAPPKNALDKMQANETGEFIPRTLEEEKGFSAALKASGFLPSRFDSVAKVIVARQMARELGLKPIVGMRQIAVIDGTASLFGDLPLAIVMQSEKLTMIEEFEFTKDFEKISFENKNLNAEFYGCVCRVKRVGSDVVRETYFTLDNAKQAGLFPETNSRKPWYKYPRYMCKYRARSQALKDVFPDALNGLAIAEYDFDQYVDADGKNDREESNAKKLETAMNQGVQ